MKHTILVLDRILAPQIKMLEEHFDIIRLWKHKKPEALIQERAHDIHGVVSSLMPVRRSLIEALPNLEIIANWAVGFDNVDMAAATERAVVVTNTPDVLTDDTADVGLLLILNVARRAVEGDAFVRAGMWHNGPLPLGTAISGKTLGIVGLGRIGQAVAHRAEAFNMNIVYFGPREKTDQPYRYYSDLKGMTTEVDFLVLTCPGGEETKHLVDYEVLEALGSAGFLINIARGSVVNEEDLLVALRNKAIAGAGLDVYQNEPNVPEAFLSMDNVVLTPHIGSATNETRIKMGQIVLDNLLAHFEGRELLTRVGV